VRAFIALKQFVVNYAELARKLKEIEERFNKQFADVFEAIGYLLHSEN